MDNLIKRTDNQYINN